MFRGTLQTSEYFEVISCTEAQIKQKKGIVLQVDGEVLGKVKQIDISIRPNYPEASFIGGFLKGCFSLKGFTCFFYHLKFGGFFVIFSSAKQNSNLPA